ncbi:hypothetical protein GIB67_037033 [Kingdonia uniflora]|uniref:Uncharacterized protein n=1 Tax=Kingdonia uniflora TaxID=39325 RepID=A0A7J7LHK4_9MAGN|nr:hypothetical protein GIB67_037033 [Kingdonia uniflora]
MIKTTNKKNSVYMEILFLVEHLIPINLLGNLGRKFMHHIMFRHQEAIIHSFKGFRKCISSKLGESQSSQVLENATRSISSMLSESQSSQGLLAQCWANLNHHRSRMDMFKSFTEKLDFT